MKKKKGSVEGCNRTCGANRAAEIGISSRSKKGSEYNEAWRKSRRPKKKDWCESEEQREPKQEVDNDQKEEKEK